MKKTLFITLEFPPQTGGVATDYKNICQNLEAESLIVLAPPTEKTADFDKTQKFKIYRQNLISKNILVWPRWRPAIFQIKKIIKAEKIEFLQVGQILPLGIIALLLKKTIKLPYLVYLHGMDITMPRGKKKHLVKKIIKNAEWIVTNSEFTKNEAVKLGGNPDKIKIIHPCPNFELLKVTDWKVEQVKQEYNFKNKSVLLTAGRLVQRKGQDAVIKILPKLLSKFPNLIYIICGEGPDLERLKLLVRNLKLEDKVIFTLKVSDNRLAALYRLCDIFVMVPRQLKNKDVEGFGIVYLEAALFGKPVIAGRSGGVTEAVIDGQTGILVEPENEEEIVAAVTKLLTDKSLAERLGQQGKERVEREFSGEKEADILKDILRK